MGFSAIIIMILAMAPSSGAVQPVPDIELSLQAADCLTDRRVCLSEASVLTASAVFDFDLLAFSASWSDVQDGALHGLGVFGLEWLAVDADTDVVTGINSVSFRQGGVQRNEDRLEWFVSFRRECAAVPGLRLEGTMVVDALNEWDPGLDFCTSYSRPLSDRIDIDAELSFGFGQADYARARIDRTGGEFLSETWWSDAGITLELPVMFGNIDIVPRVSYEAVLGDKCRRNVRTAGIDPDAMVLALALRAYWP